jgi:hypothetical protein
VLNRKKQLRNLRFRLVHHLRNVYVFRISLVC